MKTVLRPAFGRVNAPWLLLAAGVLGCWAWASRTPVPATAQEPAAAEPAGSVRLAAFQGEATTVKEAFGAVTMAWVIETHLAIGMLGDAVGKEVYDLQTGEDTLAMFESFVESNRQSLRSLAKSDELDSADQKLMRDLAKVCGLFLDQCEALRGIWEGDEAAAEDWSDLRQETGELIDAIGGGSE